MKTIYGIVVFFFVMPHSWAQLSSVGESISVARLRHRPPAKAVAIFARGIKSASTGAWQRSQQEFQRAVVLDPEFSEAWGNLGVTYMALALFDQAADNLRLAIELDPATGAHHLNYAYALIKLNRYKEAETEAKTAALLDPGNATAHYLLGFLLSQRAETLNRAVEELRDAARELPEAHYVLARIYQIEGSEAAAKQEMQAFQKLGPGPKSPADAIRVKFR